MCLSERDLDGPGLERVYEEGEVKVYRIGDPLPRAWVVHDVQTAGDDGAIDILNGDDFDPRVTAVLLAGARRLGPRGGGRELGPPPRS